MSPISKLNRIRRQQPSKARWWCRSCDARLVGDAGRCPNCSAKAATRRLKKPGPLPHGA